MGLVGGLIGCERRTLEPRRLTQDGLAPANGNISCWFSGAKLE